MQILKTYFRPTSKPSSMDELSKSSTDISEPLYDFWVTLTILNVKNMQSETSQLLYGRFFSSQNQIFFFME